MRLAAGEVLLQRLVVLVGRMVSHDHHHGARTDEARQVVDVPVRVVAGDAPVQPEDVSATPR